MHFPRRTTLPADVATRLGTDRGERPLAWAQCREGGWLVGTARALYMEVGQGFQRLGWEQIERAEWHRDESLLAVVEVQSDQSAEVRHEFGISDSDRFLELLRERVTKSVVCSVYSPLAGKAGLSVIGRRSPVGQGPVTWSYVYSVGVDRQDPHVIKVAEETRRRAEAELPAD